METACQGRERLVMMAFCICAITALSVSAQNVSIADPSIINNTAGTVNATSPTPRDNHDAMDSNHTILIIIGVVGVLVIITVVTVIIVKKRRKAKRRTAKHRKVKYSKPEIDNARK